MGVVRSAPLVGGGTIEVRSATPTDVTQLASLYESLSFEDRHRRFFSAYRPTEAFLEEWVSASERGGIVLVAVVLDGTGWAAGRVVADAGCTPLANGNAELAMTVAPEWRGWLGAYMLDALLDTARDRGIPNLEADILLENRAMLALARRRRCVMVGHEDRAVVRVCMSTAGGMPTWPPGWAKHRVLVEAPGGRWLGEGAVTDSGYHVLVCPGPEGDGLQHCPLLEGQECPLVRDADVVVWSLRPTPAGRQVLARHRRIDGQALAVEARGSDDLDLPPDAAGWPAPRHEQDAVSLVEAAIASSAAD